MTKLLAVGAAEVHRLLPMDRCIELMADALAALSRGDALNPLRAGYRLPGGKGLMASMPGALGGDAPGPFGAKLISVFPGNREAGLESHQGLIVLFEGEHGAPTAIVDAAAVTEIRTAAVSGVATRTLARADAHDLAILGSGTQARSHLAAMMAVRSVMRIRAWSPTSTRLEAFAAAASEHAPVRVEAMASAEEAVRGADLVCTVTAATEPVLMGEWLAPGAHVNAVGSSVASARELDAEAVRRARLFVDRRESALNESGDLLAAIREGIVDESHIIAELGEVLIGTVEGRRGDDEVTVFESLGLAVEDLAAAAFVAEQARAGGIGSSVEL
ncbi:MAG TPA: ornithine cyclodeaminase family protein [Candidatus Limnocylindria bacterium]|nr:ornithine cyclodeaminase family protein [Candidatus Limnocylindria bacterium]